ncbi:YkgJ family cysteine cluster protein [Patescibacteria group bacterium]
MMENKCFQCGLCCRLFLVNLTEKEYYSKKYTTQFGKMGLISNFEKAAACGANTLKQKKNGSCFYLQENRCSIHQTRPQVCREFFCTSKLKRFKKMIVQINKPPRPFKRSLEQAVGPIILLILVNYLLPFKQLISP